MKRIVLFKGGVETLGFFSQQLEKRYRELGHSVFMYDYNEEAVSLKRLVKFIERGNTVMITFNFHGICNEELLQDENSQYIWEFFDIPCYNIVVDHPFYYDRFMGQLPKNYYQISIDKNHEEYLKRFYPHIKRGPFLPLGGTLPEAENGFRLSMKERDIDVIFTGSWAEPEFWGDFMKKEGAEYETFYRSLLKEQIDNPDKTFEEIFEPRIRNEAEDADEITDELLKNTYPHLIHFDMYVRYYYRGLLVKKLTEAGIKVRCIGGGWDKLDTEKPENISHREYCDSIECLKEMQHAKISINVMPWFKRGAHDRIFNSMLAGCVCLTDSSEYLDEILTDGENCVLYRLDALDDVPDKIKALLADEAYLQNIADLGYELAAMGHTWAKRADALRMIFEENRI